MNLSEVLAALNVIATFLPPILLAMLARLVAYRARHWQYVGPIVRWFAPADDNMRPGQQGVALEGSIHADTERQQPGALPAVKVVTPAELLEEMEKITGLLEQLVKSADSNPEATTHESTPTQVDASSGEAC